MFMKFGWLQTMVAQPWLKEPYTLFHEWSKKLLLVVANRCL